MNCMYCEAQLKPTVATYNVNRQGYDIILHETPALVCVECGELFYEEQAVARIQELIREVDQKSTAVRATVPNIFEPSPAHLTA